MACLVSSIFGPCPFRSHGSHSNNFFAAGKMPRIVGMGAFTAVVLAVFDFTGGTLVGLSKQTDEDRFERKEHLRKNRRRPMEETIAQLGDGRGGSKFPTVFKEGGRTT